MASRTFRGILQVLLAVCAIQCAVPPLPASDEVFANPEAIVRGLYAAVSIEPGQKHDWDYVRSFFAPRAVLAVRKTPSTMEVISVDEFVKWFIDDVEKFRMGANGFEEAIERLKLTEFGDMAHCLVVYKARLKTPPDRPGQLGIDSFNLLKKEGRWWIVSIANEVVTGQRPLPEGLR